MAIRDRIRYESKYLNEADENGKAEIELLAKKLELLEPEFEKYDAIIDISESGRIFVKCWNQDFTQRIYRMLNS